MSNGTRYVSVGEARKLGLKRRRGEIRESDGRTFIHYYRRPGRDKIYEWWLSKPSVRKRKKRRENTLIRNREFRKRVRLRYGCRICGYKKSHHALQFDHINREDKWKAISEMDRYSRENIKKEMRKCQILCANCHAEKTQKDLDYVHTEKKNENST